MAEEKTNVIKIGNKEYELLLTTKATKEINNKFGGLEKVGTSLTQAKTVAESLEIVVWLIVLLANQSILRNNLLEGKSDALLTEENVEILTCPADLNTYSEAILNALISGTKRTVEGEDDGKNTEAE